MKIGIVTEFRGGVGIYGKNLVAGLIEQGLNLRIFSPDPLPAGIKCDDFTHVKIPLAIENHSRLLIQAYYLSRTVQNYSADLDIVHFTYAPHAGFLHDLHIPIVGTMNDYFYSTVRWWSFPYMEFYRDWFKRWGYYNIFRYFERFTLRKLTYLIACSRAVKDILSAEYHLPHDRFCDIPYGLKMEDEGLLNNHFIKEKAVLFIGGNFQRKGLLLLIKAAPMLLKNHPDLKFWIIGESIGKDWFKNECNLLGVEQAFCFFGNLSYERLKERYKKATVFTMPSYLEAFGMPYLESMYMGLPVVATKNQGPDEFLINEENAIVIPRSDSQALSSAIDRLLRDDKLRDYLITNGYNTASRYTCEKMAVETLKYYEKILSNYKK